MRKNYILLTPLPQFKLGMKLSVVRKVRWGKIDVDLSIQPLSPPLRRQLLNLAKERGASRLTT